MLLWRKNNVITTIITPYCSTLIDSAGGSYIQKVEDPTIMKIENSSKDPILHGSQNRNIEIDTSRRKNLYEGLYYLSIGGKKMDGNTGTHQ